MRVHRTSRTCGVQGFFREAGVVTAVPSDGGRCSSALLSSLWDAVLNAARRYCTDPATARVLEPLGRYL